MKVSDNRLNTLFADVVNVIWGYKCAFCGCLYNLEAHHIRSRTHLLLKWNWRNGILLCNGNGKGESCHRLAETKAGVDKIITIIGQEWYDHLVRLSNSNYKDYLITVGMTANEFKSEKAQEMQDKINEIKSLKGDYNLL